MKFPFYTNTVLLVEAPMKTMLTVQGIFYLFTGLWPLVSITTFMLVTGPKRDLWLVKAVGLMIACSGLVFTYAGLISPQVTAEVFLLAVTNCLVLAAVDIHYVRTGVIARVYLLDAVVELSLAGFYLLKYKGHP